MRDSHAVALPNGVSANGAHLRNACLRALNGGDQLFLSEDCATLSPAHWVTEALLLGVTRLGAVHPPDRDAIRALTVGDREAMLLHMHALLFGDTIRCVVTCPRESCGEKLELSLHVRELLQPVNPEARAQQEMVFEHGLAEPLRIRFRLPTGADQEDAVLLAHSDFSAAFAGVLRSCVLSDSPLTESLAASVSERMAQLDPQGDMTMRTNCPACGGEFRGRFDAAAFLRQELAEGTRDLYQEIHQLAFHYHWSADEILRMNLRTRRRYLQILAQELVQRGTQ
jgi:hypothetical protein